VTDKVHFSLAVGRPEVDVENEHAMVNVTEAISIYLAGVRINLLAIHFLSRGNVCNNESNARRGSNGSAILFLSVRKSAAQLLSAPYLQNHTFSHGEVAAQHGV
jgi:hypothetical protein